MRQLHFQLRIDLLTYVWWYWSN